MQILIFFSEMLPYLKERMHSNDSERTKYDLIFIALELYEYPAILQRCCDFND